jgi:hypothetical protein
MLLDAAVLGGLRLVGTLLAEVVYYFFVGRICFRTGEVVLRLVTWGRYPPDDLLLIDEVIVPAVGFAVLVGTIAGVLRSLS